MSAIRAGRAISDEDEARWEAACDRAHELADAIMLTPATSAVGLAIKTYLDVHDDDAKLRDDAAALSDENLGEWARALIKDAVYFVPELAPLATDAIKVVPPRTAVAPEVIEPDGVPSDHHFAEAASIATGIRALTNGRDPAAGGLTSCEADTALIAAERRIAAIVGRTEERDQKEVESYRRILVTA